MNIRIWNFVRWPFAILLAVTAGCADTTSARPADSNHAAASANAREVAGSGRRPATGRDPISPAPARSAVVLWDVTASFKPRAEALEQVFSQLLGALGPGDDLLLATIGAPSFSPRDDLRAQCRMPAVPASVLAGTLTTHDWRKNRARLAATWVEVDARTGALARLLSQPVERVTSGGTDVHGAVRYAAHRLSAEAGAERHLILLTDLLHEDGGRKTDLPPDETLTLDGVRVTAAGVPWDENRWLEKEAAWRQYVNRSGGTSFAMLDESEMLDAPLLPPTGVPRELKPPVPMVVDR